MIDSSFLKSKTKHKKGNLFSCYRAFFHATMKDVVEGCYNVGTAFLFHLLLFCFLFVCYFDSIPGNLACPWIYYSAKGDLQLLSSSPFTSQVL